MKRRPRSSLSLSRGASARAPWICLAAALGLTAAACSSDLFHDTKWQSRCDLDPDAPICPQGTGGASGTSSASSTGGAGGAGGNSSTSSASTTSGAGGGSSTTGTTTSATAASSSTG
ncbi:MAG: hypothetical protein ABI134_32885 [Byssovorax sp.]